MRDNQGEEAMKPDTRFKIFVFIAISPFTWCNAEEATSNSLQVEFQKPALTPQQTPAPPKQLSIGKIYHIPIVTYRYLDKVFNNFYDKAPYKTSIANSTFKSSDHYELVSIPLIAQNKEGVQIELFGHFADPSTQSLSNISIDQALYNYYSSTEQLDLFNSSLSIGAGISFNTSEYGKLKFIISNIEIPGYGTSNALVGFETRF